MITNRKLSAKDRESLARGIVVKITDSIRVKRNEYIQSEEYKLEVKNEIASKQKLLDGVIYDLESKLNDVFISIKATKEKNDALLKLCGKQFYTSVLSYSPNFNAIQNVEEYYKSLESKIQNDILNTRNLRQTLSEHQQKDLLAKADMEILLSENQDPIYLAEYVYKKIEASLNKSNDA